MLVILFGVGLVLTVLYISAHYNWWRRTVSAAHPRILMYHSINTDSQNISSDLVVTPANFERQVKYLVDRGYQFLTLSEIESSRVEPRTVALTFDDGFADNYEQMFPLLDKYNAKATVYLSPEIEGIRRLSTDQIKTMQASGRVEFGAHTLHHINLEKADDATAEMEIRESKRVVEQQTGEPCSAFAYPFGRFSEKNVDQVREAGFTSAVTVKKGVEAVVDPYRIKRISVLGSTNMLQFHLAITRGRYRV